MPDISMCADDACPSRLRCYRFMAEPTHGRQSYIDTGRLPGAERCGYFWERLVLRAAVADLRSIKSDLDCCCVEDGGAVVRDQG